MENPGVLPGFILGGCFEAVIKLSDVIMSLLYMIDIKQVRKL